MDKISQRRSALDRRTNLTPNEINKLSGLIISNILNNQKLNNNILLYYPIKGEVDLRPLISLTSMEKAHFSFPKIIDNKLDFRIVKNIDKDMEIKNFGIPEPKDYCPKTKLTKESTLFVPGLLFDKKGFRLGYGGGFFDKFIPTFPGNSIGVCYNFQLIEKLSILEHDIPVNFIFTEDKAIKTEHSYTGDQ